MFKYKEIRPILDNFIYTVNPMFVQQNYLT